MKTTVRRTTSSTEADSPFAQKANFVEIQLSQNKLKMMD